MIHSLENENVTQMSRAPLVSRIRFASSIPHVRILNLSCNNRELLLANSRSQLTLHQLNHKALGPPIRTVLATQRWGCHKAPPYSLSPSSVAQKNIYRVHQNVHNCFIILLDV